MDDTGHTLIIPPQDKVSPSDHFSSEEKLTKWCDNLVLSEYRDSGKRMLHLLEGMNASKIPWKQRCQLLDIIIPAFSAINHALELQLEEYLGESPLRSKALSLALGNLHQQWAIAWKIILQDLNNKKILSNINESQRKMLTEAIFHSSYSIQQKLLHIHLLYDFEPDSLWTELNTLFHLAEKYQLQDIHLPGMTPQVSSIMQCYKMCILLSISPLYNLRKPEIYFFSQTLPLLAEQCSLFQLQSTEDFPFGQLLLQMENHKKPDLMVFADIDALKPSLWVLDINQLMQEINSSTAQAIKTSVRKNYAQRLDHARVLERIAESWDLYNRRKTERHTKRNMIQAIFGFSDSYTFFNPSKTTRPHIAAADDPKFTHFDLSSHQSLAQKIIPSNCYSRDVSKSGFSLHCREKTPEVNDLLLLQQDDATLWQIAVVRWLQRSEDIKKTEFGVEILLNASQLIATHCHIGKNREKSVEALLIVPEESSQNIYQVIIPPIEADILSRYSLQCQNEKLTLNTTRYIEKLHEFYIIEFENPKLHEFLQERNKRSETEAMQNADTDIDILEIEITGLDKDWNDVWNDI